MAETLTEIGIKYDVIRINETMYVLTPKGIVEGYSVGENFYNEIVHKTAFNVESLQNEELIDSIMSIDSLKELYEYDDIEFIKEFYLAEEKDYILTIEVKNGRLIKRKVNLREFIKSEGKETYERQKDAPAVTLNCDALEELINCTNIQEAREKLERYRRLVKQYRDSEKKDSLTSVTVKNGHVTEVGVNKKVSDPKKTGPVVQTSALTPDTSAISVLGLETYLKERVFGHDDELRYIATKLIMNYRAKPEYGTESILIVGPTGTGKTETIKAASEYLGLPFVQVNTANLVPQGIKGPSLEDYLYALIVASGYDMEKAQKGFIFLDEFDKIGQDSLDIKESVKQIFLKFIEGDAFMIDKQSGDYTFNTRMLNKVFAGAFQELFEKKKTPMGFGATKQEEEFVFTPSKITEGNYYSKELVTRIHNVFAYGPLSRENQKRVMLESKLSLLLAKKRRYEEEFGVQVIIEDAYIEAILDKLSKEEKSMRDLNNLILSTLAETEYQLLANEGKIKQLILTPEIITDPKKISLK